MLVLTAYEQSGQTRPQIFAYVRQHLADIGNNPEALPLVEFALTQLWENRSPDGKLTFAQYDAHGGSAGNAIKISNRRWTHILKKSYLLERPFGRQGEIFAEILSYQRSSASICG